MNLYEIRKYFYDHKDNDKKRVFVVRIRNNDKDIIYYRGIKIFELTKRELTLSDNIFHITDNYIRENEEILLNKDTRMKKLSELAELRCDLIDKNCLTVNNELKINYEKSDAAAYFSNEQALIDKQVHLDKIKKNIKDELKDFIIIHDDYCEVNKEVLNSIENKVERMTEQLNIEYFVINAFVHFKDINWTDKNSEPYTNRKGRHLSGWVKPNFSFVNPEKKDIKDLNIESLEEIVSKVTGAVDNFLKRKFEEEKNYQHQFMLDKFIIDKFKKEGITNLYRFEEEYYTKGKEDRGRIDSIFVSEEGKDIYLIELKVNDNVIDGPNGIHKHLIDIENLYLNDNIDSFIKDLIKVVDEKRKVFEVDFNENPITWDNPKIHFYTVIAVEDNNMLESITKTLDSFNIENSQELENVKKDISKKKPIYKERVHTLDKHFDNIKQCDPRIYFDMIDYDRKEKIIKITDKPFIKYK